MTDADDTTEFRPRRVLVAGASGAGKSTLARQIATRLALPYTEIDALFHGPDWTPRPQFLDEVTALAARPAWVTEWQYDSARPLLGAAADLLVWLDHPWPLTMSRVVRRTVRRARRREVLWNGNVEPGLWHGLTRPEGVVRWSWSTRLRFAALVPEMQSRRPDLVVIRLRGRGAVDRWLTWLDRRG